MKAVTFDSVPWVVTMKKNEHYFPTVELIKDPSDPCGWRRVTYEGGKVAHGTSSDGVVTANDEQPDMDIDGEAPVREEE
jgi:hypothetical protein